jgi:hypothetical protein
VFQIPYGLIPTVAVVWLTYQHVQTAPASDRAKWRLIGCAALAVILTSFWPIVGVLAQVSVCAYVLLYRIVASDADRESLPREEPERVSKKT